MALNLLQAVYRNSSLDLSVRMRAAALLAIAYESPKLAVTALIDNERDFGAILDRRLKHMETLRVNEVKMIEATPVEVKAPTPSINFRSLNLRRRI